MVLENSKKLLRIVGLYKKPEIVLFGVKVPFIVLQCFCMISVLWSFVTITAFVCSEDTNFTNFKRGSLFLSIAFGAMVLSYKNFIQSSFNIEFAINRFEEIVSRRE